MSDIDYTEKDFEKYIVNLLISRSGYIQGNNNDYNPQKALLPQTFISFIKKTQPDDGPGMFKMLRQKIALADWESEFYGEERKLSQTDWEEIADTTPCPICGRMIANAGIDRVVSSRSEVEQYVYYRSTFYEFGPNI